MKIGIDISQSVYEGTGVGRFTRGLVHAITNYNIDDKWYLFFSSLRKPISKEILQIIQSKHFSLITKSIPPTLLSVVWNTLGIMPIDSIIPDLDWFITSDWAEAPSKTTKKITIIHDLSFIRYPETVHPFIRFTQSMRLKRVQKESSLIITDSQATKDDLIRYTHIPYKTMRVIYPGVEITIPSKNAELNVPKKYHIDRPYILSVGKIEPRKNLSRLITAFSNLQNQNIDLLIVGLSGWGEQLGRIDNPRIRFLGYVSNEDLAVLYSRAVVFVYPSLWEGFGYPVAEAMKYGTPVACSNIPSLKEIGENTVTYFDPLSIGDIAQSLTTLLNDPHKRKIFSQKAKKRAELFEWNRYYTELTQYLHTFKK